MSFFEINITQFCMKEHVEGLVQDCSNSSALAGVTAVLH